MKLSNNVKSSDFLLASILLIILPALQHNEHLLLQKTFFSILVCTHLPLCFSSGLLMADTDPLINASQYPLSPQPKHCICQPTLQALR